MKADLFIVFLLIWCLRVFVFYSSYFAPTVVSGKIFFFCDPPSVNFHNESHILRFNNQIDQKKILN